MFWVFLIYIFNKKKIIIILYFLNDLKDIIMIYWGIVVWNEIV